VVSVAGPFGERAHLHVAYGGRIVDGDPVLLPGAVLPAHVSVLGLGDGAALGLDDPPEQLPVEVLAERAADQVERDGIDARVAVAQAEAGDAQHVPEYVVIVLGLGVQVEPQHEHVIGQEAHGEHQHERQYGLGHFLPGPDLPHLSLKRERIETNSLIVCTVKKKKMFIIFLKPDFYFLMLLNVV